MVAGLNDSNGVSGENDGWEKAFAKASLIIADSKAKSLTISWWTASGNAGTQAKSTYPDMHKLGLSVVVFRATCDFEVSETPRAAPPCN